MPKRCEQHDEMVKAVQNHTPEVLIIDEIGTEEEVRAAASIASRGVTLIASAHAASEAKLRPFVLRRPPLPHLRTIPRRGLSPSCFRT